MKAPEILFGLRNGAFTIKYLLKLLLPLITDRVKLMTNTNTTTEPRYPNITVQLSGNDGNAFAVMATVRKALRRAGVSAEEVSEYVKQSTAGDYDNLLRVAMSWVNCD